MITVKLEISMTRTQTNGGMLLTRFCMAQRKAIMVQDNKRVSGAVESLELLFLTAGSSWQAETI